MELIVLSFFNLTFQKIFTDRLEDKMDAIQHKESILLVRGKQLVVKTASGSETEKPS